MLAKIKSALLLVVLLFGFYQPAQAKPIPPKPIPTAQVADEYEGWNEYTYIGDDGNGFSVLIPPLYYVEQEYFDVADQSLVFTIFSSEDHLPVMSIHYNPDRVWFSEWNNVYWEGYDSVVRSYVHITR